MTRSLSLLALCPLAVLLAACSKSSAPAAPAAEPEMQPAWQIVAAALPSALMSVDGASAKDLYAVGADKGDGPLVLHFDGSAWKELPTGQVGDLWWVHAFPDGTAILGGASALVLRLSGGKFERIPTPGLGRQTVYGVWGKSPGDFYAVGSASGRNGFVWHYKDGAFHDEALPRGLPLVSHGEPPGFFKAWGSGDDVWVVGSGGSLLHRKGDAPFSLVPTGVKDILFTVSGVGERWVAVGGGSNGLAFEGGPSALKNVTPPAAGLLQGVFASDADGDWASGERGAIYHRAGGKGAFLPVDHQLPLPPAMSLHAIFVDASHEVWSVGGNVLSPALDSGFIVHYGKPVPSVVPHASAMAMMAGPHATCPKEVVDVAKDKSIARRWDEQALAAIRLDLPRPTVHARNLYHLSAAMWDAWAAYEPGPRGVFDAVKVTAKDVEAARKTAISYAAFGVLSHRYKPAVGGATTVACLTAVMKDLGLDPTDTHADGTDPIAVGNDIAHRILEATANDGSNEANDYADTTHYTSPNDPLVYDDPGTIMKDPDVWQPINLSVSATQNGIVLPAGVQTYIGAQWDDVAPFAMKRASRAVPWHDPGPVPKVGPSMKGWLMDVIRKEAYGDTSDGVTMDVSPGAYGHNSLGANDGKGWAKNPVTGKPYAPEIVLRGDFARVMAEFWADGPKSETPPGHWNVLANYVADSPHFTRKLYGTGEPLDALSWDVHAYLALNGAVHDAAITAWGTKRRTLSSRPICLIRWMGEKGQSSDPKGPSYDPEGLLLAPGLVEVVTKESSAPGQRHERLASYVGQVAIRGWRGEPGDRAKQASGVTWIRAVDWITYQRRNFVTPAFPGFISGHSTFSRAGAEALTALTGSPYFPGGFAEYVAPAGKFLKFEKGPVREVRLQWAAYADASDEAGQSRLWGGIHIEPDDFVGRRLGALVGKDAVEKAGKYFRGEVP